MSASARRVVIRLIEIKDSERLNIETHQLRHAAAKFIKRLAETDDRFMLWVLMLNVQSCSLVNRNVLNDACSCEQEVKESIPFCETKNKNGHKISPRRDINQNPRSLNRGLFAFFFEKLFESRPACCWGRPGWVVSSSNVPTSNCKTVKLLLTN